MKKMSLPKIVELAEDIADRWARPRFSGDETTKDDIVEYLTFLIKELISLIEITNQEIRQHENEVEEYWSFDYSGLGDRPQPSNKLFNDLKLLRFHTRVIQGLKARLEQSEANQ